MPIRDHPTLRRHQVREGDRGLSTRTQAASTPPPRLPYVPELDGMRGYGVLAVIAIHAGVPGFQGAFLAVDMFFVMSGFLIASLLIQERQTHGSISLGHFYLRRAVRLVPALVVFLAAAAAYGALCPGSHDAGPTLQAVPLTLAHVANLARAAHWHTLGLIDHTWSLAIEEQFYLLVAPLLALLLARRVPLRRLAVLFVVGAAAITLQRARLWAATGDMHRVYFGTDTHGDGLLLGVAAACLYRSGLVPRSASARRALQAASLASIAALAGLFAVVQVDRPAFLFRGGYTLVAVLVAVVVYQVVTAPLPSLRAVLGMGWVVFVGRMSYGLYLWHLPVLRAFRPADAVERPVEAAARALLAVGIAAASFVLVERRFLRLKKRYRGVSPTRTPAELAPVAA